MWNLFSYMVWARDLTFFCRGKFWHAAQNYLSCRPSSHQWLKILLFSYSNVPWLHVTVWILYSVPLNFLYSLYSSAQFSHSVVSNSLRPHGLQHARPPCPLPTPGVYSNSCPLSQWCHPTISFSVVPFSSCLQSFPASGSFAVSQFFSSGGQRIGVSASASVLPVNN